MGLRHRRGEEDVLLLAAGPSTHTQSSFVYRA